MYKIIFEGDWIARREGGGGEGEGVSEFYLPCERLSFFMVVVLIMLGQLRWVRNYYLLFCEKDCLVRCR